MKPLHKKILIVVAIVLVLSAIAYGVYTTVFQFNDQDVRDYIAEEAKNYPEEKREAVTKIIRDGVRYILDDKELTKKVLAEAKKSGTPREMELVHEAVMQAQANGYLKPKL